MKTVNGTVPHRFFKACKASGWDIIKAAQLSHATEEDIREAGRSYPIFSSIVNKYLELGGRKDLVETLHAAITEGACVNLVGASGCGKTFISRWYAEVCNFDYKYVTADQIKNLRQFHTTRSIAGKKKMLVVDDVTLKHAFPEKILKVAKCPVIFVSDAKLDIKLEDSSAVILETIVVEDDEKTREAVIRHLFQSDDRIVFSAIAKQSKSVGEAISVCRGGAYSLVSKTPTAKEVTERILADPDRKHAYNAILTSSSNLGTIVRFVTTNLPYFYMQEPELLRERFSALQLADLAKFVTKPKYTAAVLAYGITPSRGTRSIVNPFDEFKKEEQKEQKLFGKKKKKETEGRKQVVVTLEKKKKSVFDAWLKK